MNLEFLKKLDRDKQARILLMLIVDQAGFTYKCQQMASLYWTDQTERAFHEEQKKLEYLKQLLLELI